jgi:hypothetical protein
MPGAAVATPRHAMRRGMRGALVVALLAFLITTLTPGFAHVPLPDGGYCAASELPHVASTDDEDCAVPQAHALLGSDTGVHHGGGHHGGSQRTFAVSACHYRSRLGPVDASALVSEGIDWTFCHDTRLSIPASVHCMCGAPLPPSAILRC